MVTAIVLASGKGERMGMGAVDKCFLSLGSRPVLAWSLLAFEKCNDIDQIVLTVRKEQVNAARGVCQMFGISKIRIIIAGGSRRQDSVMNGLKEVDPDTRYVVIHDAARPCVTPELISDTVKYARRYGSGVAAAQVTDTIKVAEKGMMVAETPDRSHLWAAMTPQTFQFDPIFNAYKTLIQNGKKSEVFTDDASVFEAAGGKTRLVEWTKSNIKITTAEDMTVAAALLRIS